ncbi:PREDICTED: ankyrin-3-like [Acromyrmex echinatior]|uniref:ankyrin-3-like n=1 Tax=Acromyrmex echinatior TaxID=103372 RepID=UPI000580EC86|nr:PREDICTED: ankyrin-3-like [Acromyrmex echinatior]
MRERGEGDTPEEEGHWDARNESLLVPRRNEALGRPDRHGTKARRVPTKDQRKASLTRRDKGESSWRERPPAETNEKQAVSIIPSQPASLPAWATATLTTTTTTATTTTTTTAATTMSRKKKREEENLKEEKAMAVPR